MILRQNHAASDTHDPIFVDKTRNSNIKYSRDENMDDEEKWNNDQSASEKYSRNVLVDKGINLKLQLPLKGQTFNPVVRGFVEQLKRKGEVAKDVEIENIGQYAKSHLQLRDTDLNAKELKNIKNCKASSKQDYLILEPLTPYTDILEKKFAGNEKVSIYNIGLGSDNEVVMVNLEGNNACATTKFSKKNGTVPIYIVNAIDFLTDLGVGVYELDLLTMNCEGCEFEVLETLVKSNLIERIRNIQWATHTQVSIPNPWERYCRIHELLKRTHRPTYQYKFNWESWRRKDIK
uniref:Methyltransferase FkbM domain-containing protein n=1 Tax=Magallana gigas TaxID=29159 RepID=A0A8W8N2R9_MAGGI